MTPTNFLVRTEARLWVRRRATRAAAWFRLRRPNPCHLPADGWQQAYNSATSKSRLKDSAAVVAGSFGPAPASSGPRESIIGAPNDNYEIVSVEPTDPPADTGGKGWHCYTIQQGRNTIRGYRRGNIQFVTRAVEEIVARLNERRYGKIGRVHLVMSSHSKKAKASTQTPK